MTYELKRISTAGITEAIAKAELYRSLNEPEEAESICRDILAIEPQHQLALRLLGLALTDQFTGGSSDRDREAEKPFFSSVTATSVSITRGCARTAREGAATRRTAASYGAASLRARDALFWGGRKDPSAQETMMPSFAGIAVYVCCKPQPTHGNRNLLRSKCRTHLPHRPRDNSAE